MAYLVHITKTATAETRVHREEGAWTGTDEFHWLENNNSCDCNRALFFGWAGGAPDNFDEDCACGETAYAVIITDEDGKELARDYDYKERMEPRP